MNRRELVDYIYESFIGRLQEDGIEVNGVDETGTLCVGDNDGGALEIRLDNLINYYAATGDPKAISDFASRVADMVKPREERWEDVKNNVFISLLPGDAASQDNLSTGVTDYVNRFYTVGTRTRLVTRGMLEKWGVESAELESRAMENAERLLDATAIEIEDVEGRPLGSFIPDDANLNATLLLAPNLKNLLAEDFGFPLYAVIPDKSTCYFFCKEDYGHFELRIASLVAETYSRSTTPVTPELLEISDEGIKPVCSWTMQMGRIIRLDN